jgi:hypothetical protein
MWSRLECLGWLERRSYSRLMRKSLSACNTPSKQVAWNYSAKFHFYYLNIDAAAPHADVLIFPAQLHILCALFPSSEFRQYHWFQSDYFIYWMCAHSLPCFASQHYMTRDGEKLIFDIFPTCLLSCQYRTHSLTLSRLRAILVWNFHFERRVNELKHRPAACWWAWTSSEEAKKNWNVTKAFSKSKLKGKSVDDEHFSFKYLTHLLLNSRSFLSV